jgi:alkanesulfonate monooxygenase SsuD/methylene tetrahydromethanopterin reductase-like flavin-dependent oxidoreductase (luciferase family)
MDDLTARFTAGLEALARLVRGETDGPLVRDAAVARCRDHPIPLLSAAASVTAVRRAAANGCGLLLDSLSTTARCRELSDAYRAAGGDGPVVLVRRCWLGDTLPAAFEQQVAVYRSYAPDAATTHWGRDELAQAADAAVVAERLVAAAGDAGATALNLRVHVPGVEPAEVREQIEALGEAVVPRVRHALGTVVAR